MDHQQAQENLSHLVNIEALLNKLNAPRPMATASALAFKPSLNPASTAKPSPATSAHWPMEAVSARLREKLDQRQSLGPLPLLLNPSATASFAKLNQLLEILTVDVFALRDRLLMLNPGRRKMIEHRLEFIARKVARLRGERLNRSLSLPDILKESYRDAGQVTVAPKLGIAAWRGFVSEVALYNLLQIFFLKSLNTCGWREFSTDDLGRMNFAAHTFLSQRASGFAFDKHCWNFVRTNLYSWYVPSQKALDLLTKALEGFEFSWSDRELEAWVTEIPAALRPTHLDYASELSTSKFLVDLLEDGLATPVTTHFQGRVACKKFFLPALELGGVALAVLDRLLNRVSRHSGAADGTATSPLLDESSQFHRTLWACEIESFEIFWTEVLALLKIMRGNAPERASEAQSEQASGLLCPYRIPHALHTVQSLALELHNLEQLPLGSPEVSKMQQGSAAQIQQIENFDVAFVTDHIDRAKSAAWMKALAQQLPYWRSLVGNGTNLNWGELHLHLAMTKLKESGCCIYASHRTLPESGDGEKLRRALLNLGTLDYFIELPENSNLSYRYLYVFRRVGKKTERDQHHPRFGRVRDNHSVDLKSFEEASCSQAEIAERGWDHLFVRGAAPLVRHLNHKFPKLFQIASIVSGAADAHAASSTAEFQVARGARGALELKLDANAATGGTVRFCPVSSAPAGQSGRDRWFVFPHNPVDLSWIECMLNSAPAQFWIRHQILANNTAALKAPRYQEIRSCPIVDLSLAPSNLVHVALDWMGETKPDAATLRAWACSPEMSAAERYARYVAVAKRHSSLARIVERYRPFFTGPSFEEILPEAVPQFYPSALLCQMSQSPDLRIQYAERGTSPLMPENWTLETVQSVVKDLGGKPMAYTVVRTRQGPVIQILLPLPIRDYIGLQLQALQGHSWGEALSMLRVPRDISLFSAQTSEISRVVRDTARELEIHQQVLGEMALDLFEIPADMRQFLPQM